MGQVRIGYFGVQVVGENCFGDIRGNVQRFLYLGKGRAGLGFWLVVEFFVFVFGIYFGDFQEYLVIGRVVRYQFRVRVWVGF